jgi:glycine/D-amino acid oxidase-like deaminating enzyme
MQRKYCRRDISNRISIALFGSALLILLVLSWLVRGGVLRVGVLGGGMQGCCCALAMAERGADVVLFDRNATLLSRAAVANEGKIHLGYMYANDPSYATARMMINGALAFAPFIARHLGVRADSLSVSSPAAYAVHRDSQRNADQVAQYLSGVHTLIVEAAEGWNDAYFGIDLQPAPRAWSAAEREAEFGGDVVLAAFDSPEVAVNPVTLTEALRARVHADPRIEVRLLHDVISVEDIDHPVVVVRDSGSIAGHRFDHVVNALWDGRMAIDEKLGFRPERPWLHRLKYGMSFHLPVGARRPSSTTFVSGPLGEVVSYTDGLIYLTWYPTCLLGISRDVVPPDWPTYPDERVRATLARSTLEAMSRFIVPLRNLDPDDLADLTVKGGVIVAWGKTDIYDPRSELHRRYEIGVTSNRHYHSIDPGKLTMAPYFAQICAERVLENAFA